jgi:nitrite reductase (NO-forming)
LEMNSIAVSVCSIELGATSMRAYRLVVILSAVVVAIGCAGNRTPGWTAAPRPGASGATTAGPNSQTATQTPAGTASTASSTPSASVAPDPGDGNASVVPALTPKADLLPVPQGELNVTYAPNVPPATNRSSQALVDVWFDIVEGVKAIDPNGLKYTTWGYRKHGDTAIVSGTPGPMIRARVGDLLRFTLTNLPENSMPHNVDFHAVTGQGGGAADTTVAPGETKTIEARLLYPGLFMYHCAAGDVPMHIAQGMYGGILVDPERPLNVVAHELYMVQSEYYTTDPQDGALATDRQAVTDEAPQFVVFNGAVGALTGDNAPRIHVGETLRIYFVNAGLNLDSNFHPIGSHWDKVYQEGALLNQPLRGSQTTLVPAGGSTVVELIAQVPQTIVLVDHALARAFDKGAIGQVVVEGEPNPEIFEAVPGSTSPGTPPPSPRATPSTGTSPTPTATSSHEGENVNIVPGAFTFQPTDAPDEFSDTESPADYSANDLMVTVGTLVTWTNNDPGMAHTVTAADGSFDSGMLSEGDTFSYTFDSPGTFEYFCTPHPWMRARVTVMMH